MEFIGLLYRALNPVYAAAPLSGRGAELFGGRFNPKGMPALYTALSPELAIRESNQVGNLQPTTLVAYRAKISGLFDARDESELRRQSKSLEAIARSDWRLTAPNSAGQQLARDLSDTGFPGLIAYSYSKGAKTTDFNIVLWRWGKGAGPELTVIDDEDRLKNTAE